MTNFEHMIARAGLLENEASAHIGYMFSYDKVTEKQEEEYHSTFTGETFPTRDEAYRANLSWLNDTYNEKAL